MKHSLWLAVPLFLLSCRKDPPAAGNFSEDRLKIAGYAVNTYSSVPRLNSKYLVVFDAGLGDYSKVWRDSKVPDSLLATTDVVLYDRAGYNNTPAPPSPRNVERMSADLDSVIRQYANGRKVVLVSHSLGGYIARDYAIKNPAKVAALLFVDPSHELYNGLLDQPTEDQIYNAFRSLYGAGYGATLEARELIEDAQYMATLPPLPAIPVTVITSMLTDAGHDAADRQLWFQAHEMLGNGVRDFTHLTTTISGHYIMKTEPGLVKTQIRALLSRLP